MKTTSLSMVGIALITSGFAMASEHGTSTDLLLDDSIDFLAVDEFEVVFAAEAPPTLFQRLGFSIQETLGWSNNQSALFLHQTTANAKWAGSLSPAWYLEWDASAVALWPATPLMTNTETTTASEFNMNTVYLQYSNGPVSAKIGRYSIGWGELEGAGVLDIVNPAPDLTQGNPSAADNGQWLASGRFYGDGWELSGFYNLDPELSAFLPKPTTKELELGFRLGTQIMGSDVSLYAGQFIEDTPIITIFPITPTGDPTTEGNSYRLIGIAANKAIGNWLLKADIASKNGLMLYNSLAPSTKSFDRVDFGAGVEYNAPSGQQYGATLYGRRWLELDGSSGALALQNFPPSIIPALDTEAGAMLRFSDSFMNDDLSLTLISTGDLSGAMVMVNASLGYQLNDQWSGDLQVTMAKAKADSLYASFDGEVLVVLSVKWQY